MINKLLKNKVSDQLYWDTRINDSKIDVEANDCVVTLRGEVASYFEKSAAEECAWSIPGTCLVKDEITVKYPMNYDLPLDEDINNQIQRIIQYNLSLKDTDIDVRTHKGVVTLSGSADYYWKKVMIENLVYNMSGVVNIVNKISVVPSLDINDEDIASDIVDTIDRNRYLDVNLINVKVENGEVTLSGTVPNWYAGETALKIAEYTLGVIDVTDNLQIG